MEENYRELGYESSETRFADVRAARAARQQTRRQTGARIRDEPVVDVPPWAGADDDLAPQPKGSFGRVLLVQAIVCALLAGGVFACKSWMPNTYGQLRRSYQGVMRTDMSVKEVWAAAVAAFRQLREDIYVMVPYQNAAEARTDPAPGGGDSLMGVGGFDLAKEYAARKCTAAPLLTTVRPVRPLAEGRLTCSFGYRVHPITKDEGVHTGMDIAAPEGTPVRAAFYGTVLAVGEGETMGLYVIMNHGGGLQSVYEHCAEQLVQEGMVIRPGEVIAKVGSTGLSTGPHLHFEVRLNGQRCDPAPLFGDEMYSSST
ncbi:MAG: M23 family metallopeptidase [Oscillospiraceae bacterium]|nr:M23 family metallopeptidase [Oscillospiraceae bacterium]